MSLALAVALGTTGAARAASPTGLSPGPDQASAADLLGRVLTGEDGRPLGRVSDLLIDGVARRVAFIGLELPGAGKRVVALPWTALAPAAALSGGYRATGTGAAAVAEDLPFAQQAAADPADLDVQRDLLGRPVLAAAGERVGRLIDFDVDLRSGGIGDLFITTTEVADGGRRLRAIPWDAIADLGAERAIVLRLDAASVLHSPDYAAVAADRPPNRLAGG
ncbi:MAG TPA: PRC-barrel domain-containing protein [Stellaceae bacterium]|nr:PRC-barrel domain-containing protein [Stellaceae bacterium]